MTGSYFILRLSGHVIQKEIVYHCCAAGLHSWNARYKRIKDATQVTLQQSNVMMSDYRLYHHQGQFGGKYTA